MSNSSIDRRKFLKSSAILGGGLFISFSVAKAGGPLGKLFSPEPGKDFMPNAFLNIKPDNTVRIILSHVEMGQGIWTTLPMLIAEELDLDWKNVSVEHSPVGDAYNHAVFGLQITGGSSSTWSEFDRYRQAGAVARKLLVEAGAKKLGVSPENCTAVAGFVVSGSKKLSYGELANDAALLAVPASVELKKPADWKYVGKGLKRLDAPLKTNGAAVFGMDIQDKELLTAVVMHSPVYGGKVKSFNADETLKVPGVRQVVEIPTGVAVIADHFWAASEGRKLLKVVWNDGEGVKLTTSEQIKAYKNLASKNGLPADQKGNVAGAFSRAAKIVKAEYTFPYLAHAAMEPINCTVKVEGDKCEIWTGTQMPGIDRAAAAKILGIAPDKIKITTPFLGGGFGRRATAAADFVSEAAHIAKASGKHIKMVWTREDDMKGGYYRPVYVHKLEVGLDAAGKPLAWLHNVAGQSIMANTMMAAMIKDGIDDTSIEGVKGSPYLTGINDYFIGLHTTETVIPPLWFRSVGHTHTGFVMETIIDELAHAAATDPVLYRKKLLKDHPRHLAALSLAAEKAQWGKPLPAGHFRGVAVHESFESFVAHVIEISMKNGSPVVHKVTCAIDCGTAVNPDGVTAQMESGIVFGLTMALYGEVTIEKGRIQQNNFYDYKILRMHESPKIEVHIVNSSEKMGGAGECGVPPVAPALVNAIFAATGKRVYNLPLMNTNFNNA